MKQKKRSRMVKLYFRDQDKVMRAIPNLEGLVRDDVLRKVYTLKGNSSFPDRHYRKTIYIIGDDE